jgi:hypothetical protein
MRAVQSVAVVLIASASLTAQATPERRSERKQAAQAAPASQEQKADPQVNADALALKDFKDRIDKYVELHRRAAKGAPPLKETTDPNKIKNAENTLATTIRAERSTAQPGDIFTPAIRDNFRRLLSPPLKGRDGQDAKQILKDDAPGGVPLKVNAKYPEGAPLPTVPAHLLANLPTLPKEVEYRIVGKHLILRDTEADIIVDYIPNAIP